MYNAQVDAIELTDHDEMLPPIFILGRIVENTHTKTQDNTVCPDERG